jgi:hypothetical protein
MGIFDQVSIFERLATYKGLFTTYMIHQKEKTREMNDD